MSISFLIAAIASLAGMVSVLIMIVGMFSIELILVPRHRRRTGLDLIYPIPPLPGQTAGMVGLCLVWPWFHKRTGNVITIDKAARIWRWIAIITVWAGGVFLVSIVLGYFFLPEGS